MAESDTPEVMDAVDLEAEIQYAIEHYDTPGNATTRTEYCFAREILSLRARLDEARAMRNDLIRRLGKKP